MTKIFISLFIISFCFGKEHFVSTDKENQKLYDCINLPNISEMEKELKELYKLEDPKSSKEIFNLDGFKIYKNKDQLTDLNILTYDRPFLESEANTNRGINQADLNSKKKIRTAPHPDLKYTRSYDLSDFQKNDSQCLDIVCASKLIFGETKGIKILWAYKKYALNLSRYQFIHGIDFEESDLDASIKALMFYPPYLHKTLTDKGTNGFFRFKKGYKMALNAGPNTVANAFGAIFDPIDHYPPSGKMYIFMHEMAHRTTTFKRNDGSRWDDSPQWLKAMGWKCPKENYSLLAKCESPKDYISKYAETNPKEDFAESVAAYLISPNKLKEMSPSRYNFIKKNIFQGNEPNPERCETATTLAPLINTD